MPHCTDAHVHRQSCPPHASDVQGAVEHCPVHAVSSKQFAAARPHSRSTWTNMTPTEARSKLVPGTLRCRSLSSLRRRASLALHPPPPRMAANLPRKRQRLRLLARMALKQSPSGQRKLRSASHTCRQHAPSLVSVYCVVGLHPGACSYLTAGPHHVPGRQQCVLRQHMHPFMSV